VDFVADKPGHFMGRLTRATAGTYRANISLASGSALDNQGLNSKQLPEVAWEIDGADFGERPHRTPDFSLLNDIAQQSGGLVDPKPDDLVAFLHQEQDKKSYAHEFLLISLSLILLEFFLRVLGVKRG
jgi:hypothetical protein